MGITVQYLNPSFLLKKVNGGFCLVTAFADVGRYSFSRQPSVESTVRLIAQWKYIVATNLTHAFYQLPLLRESMN